MIPELTTKFIVIPFIIIFSIILIYKQRKNIIRYLIINPIIYSLFVILFLIMFIIIVFSVILWSIIKIIYNINNDYDYFDYLMRGYIDIMLNNFKNMYGDEVVIPINKLADIKDPKEYIRCTICCKSEIDSVLECGHVFCNSCIRRMEKCPRCNSDKIEFKKIFL